MLCWLEFSPVPVTLWLRVTQTSLIYGRGKAAQGKTKPLSQEGEFGPAMGNIPKGEKLQEWDPR